MSAHNKSVFSQAIQRLEHFQWSRGLNAFAVTLPSTRRHLADSAFAQVNSSLPERQLTRTCSQSKTEGEADVQLQHQRVRCSSQRAGNLISLSLDPVQMVLLLVVVLTAFPLLVPHEDLAASAAVTDLLAREFARGAIGLPDLAEALSGCIPDDLSSWNEILFGSNCTRSRADSVLFRVADPDLKLV